MGSEMCIRDSSYGVHAELSREPRAEAPIMSAMHAGVMTTSTETMYAQRVTLTVVREFETRHPFIFVPGKCLLFFDFGVFFFF